jgi:hypothetical protein
MVTKALLGDAASSPDARPGLGGQKPLSDDVCERLRAFRVMKEDELGNVSDEKTAVMMGDSPYPLLSTNPYDGSTCVRLGRLRDILDTVFGTGGWCLLPLGEVVSFQGEALLEFALLGHGRVLGSEPSASTDLLRQLEDHALICAISASEPTS